MEYKFAVKKQNYEDFSSGKVLYYAHGQTSFPVRLGSEIFQRCVHHLQHKGHNGPYMIYDPCCGGAYLLTVIGYLHGTVINKIAASDVNAEILRAAGSNLSLLTPGGLQERIEHIEAMLVKFGKPSHQEALESAARLRHMLEQNAAQIETSCFHADILSEENRLGESIQNVDIVITDVPYGENVFWTNEQEYIHPITVFLDKLIPVLNNRSIVAVIANKSQKLRHDKYNRLEYFKIGKRHVALFTPKK